MGTPADDIATAASGAIVAGGTSGRLGRDKRFVTVDGVGLLAGTAATLGGLVDDLQVVLADPEDEARVIAEVGGDVTITYDRRSDVGPAAGLEAALTAARHEHVIVVATDHPALSPDVLALLLARARGTPASAVALTGPRGSEPFVAVYRRDALATVTAALDAGTRRMQDVLAALGPLLIGEQEWRSHDPTGRTIDDVDTPADLDRFR